MPIESNNFSVQRYFKDHMSTVQEPSEVPHGGHYDGASEDEKITEMQRLANSKAAHQAPSEILNSGDDHGVSEDEKIRNRQQLENSKAAQMVNLNIKQRI